ncbi:retrovirus-related pol polyprotein from transposon TNT 1-94 [Tanacetum coccineum]
MFKSFTGKDFGKPCAILGKAKHGSVWRINQTIEYWIGSYMIHGRIVGIKRLHDDLEVTVAKVCVTVAKVCVTAAKQNVSRPQLKSNRLEDRVMHNNSQGKKQQVEDHRRNFKFSNNKMSVTACNDSLNAKTSNVNFVCVTCGKCVLNDNHDMCVLHYINGVNSRTKRPIDVPISTRKSKRTVNQSVATSLKKTVALKSTNQKPRSIIRKQYEYVSKTCKWWYSKITPPGYKWEPKSKSGNLVEIILFIVDSGCSKYMTENLKLLRNVTIKKVYHVEGLNHNLFSVGQFCDADLEVSFWKSTCYIRDLKGNDILTGGLWHCRLSHLNFDTINMLSKYDIVIGLPKLKFVKDHLCSSCEFEKAKRKSFKTKTTPSSKRRLQLLHMDLCGLMRVEIFNGNKYVLVIVDDYSRYTWTRFLISKDETPKVLINFLKLVQRGLHAQVRTILTDKGTEFLNKTLHEYFSQEGIKHQTSYARTPEQNGVVERRNHTLVEAARTMLSAAKVPLFFWAESLHVYNKRTRLIVETIDVKFNELPLIASDNVTETVTTSNEPDLLFSPMFVELLNGTTLVVSKSSDVHAADAPDQRQQQNTTPSTSTTIAADTPSLNIQTTPVTTSQAPTITATENINQAETHEENAQVNEDEFINIFSTPVHEQGEISFCYVDSSNMHTFYQRHPSEHRRTRDHPLEQSSLEILLSQLEQDVS